MADETESAGGTRRGPLHAFAELALISVDESTPAETLRRVAELAKQTLPEVKEVSLILLEKGRPRSVAFTGPLAVDLDERQHEAGFGPCLDAAVSGQTIVVDMRSGGSPYREFAQVALRAGVQHSISVGMPLRQRSIGGLNIYRSAATGFARPFIERAEAFAGYAAVAVNNVASYAAARTETAQLREAMASRAVIDQAKGVMMVRERCTANEAFDLLTRISQHQNVKLRDLAQAIVDGAHK